MVLGDWNVIPTDDDVWDPSKFEGATHVSQPERDAVQHSALVELLVNVVQFNNWPTHETKANRLVRSRSMRRSVSRVIGMVSIKKRSEATV